MCEKCVEWSPGFYDCDSDCGPNEVCCDSGCEPECTPTEPTGHCDEDNNEDSECPGCAGYLFVTCGDVTYREYTGNVNHGCTGGCPGDCARQPDVLCYTEYYCKEGILEVGICGEEEGAPGGVACQSIGSDSFCIPCKKMAGLGGEDFHVTHYDCE